MAKRGVQSWRRKILSRQVREYFSRRLHAYILKALFFCIASLIERETNSINDFVKTNNKMNQFQEKQLVFSRQKRKVNTTHEIKRDEEKSWSVALLSSKLSEV